MCASGICISIVKITYDEGYQKNGDNNTNKEKSESNLSILNL